MGLIPIHNIICNGLGLQHACNCNRFSAKQVSNLARIYSCGNSMTFKLITWFEYQSHNLFDSECNRLQALGSGLNIDETVYCGDGKVSLQIYSK